MATTDVKKNMFYLVSFSYGLGRQTLRYIPWDEISECYFILCNDPHCKARKYAFLHSKGIRGCSSGFKPCIDENCKVKKKHISHPGCINRRKNEPLPSFIDEHLVDSIPDDEMVYHFTKKSFNKERGEKSMTKSHGTFHFDDANKQGYILSDGLQVFTTPMFDFFNGLISLNTLMNRLDLYYTHEQISWFNDKLIDWEENKDNADFYNKCRDFFNF